MGNGNAGMGMGWNGNLKPIPAHLYCTAWLFQTWKVWQFAYSQYDLIYSPVDNNDYGSRVGKFEGIESVWGL